MTTKQLSIVNTFAGDNLSLESSLKTISSAGFTHVHWTSHWDDDFIYDNCEIKAIAQLLKRYDLKLLDTHSSAGKSKCWFSPCDWQRQAGCQMIRNHIDMTKTLGGDAVVVHHCHRQKQPPERRDKVWTALRKSLDELSQHCIDTGIPIAIENAPNDNFEDYVELFQQYPPEVLGLCYDSGHGNMFRDDSLALLEQVKDRLLVVHLHDNNSQADQHRVPFHGNADWPAILKTIADSPYNKPLNLEVSLQIGGYTSCQANEFAAMTKLAGDKLVDMFEQIKQ